MSKIRIPKYCRHKSTNRAYVTFPGKPRGTVKYLGAYGSEESHEAYRAAISAWLMMREEGAKAVEQRPPAPVEQRPPAPPTVARMAALFLEWARGYYRKRGEPTSQALTVDLTLRVMIAEFGATPAASFDAQALKRVRESFVASGLCRNECNRRARVVKQCLGWAVEEGLIPAAGWHSCLAVKGLKKDRTPARETIPVRPVPLEVVEACLPHMPRPVAAMVRLQLLTGMRPDEACQIAPGMIDRSEATWVYRPDRHKTEHHGHVRAVPLGPKARELVESWADWGEPSKPLFSPAVWMEERAKARRASRRSKLQPSQRDRSKPDKRRAFADRYAEPTYRQAVGRAAKSAGQPDWTPHQLRHTYATLVRARYGLEASQVLLGHASADVTQIYAERDLKRAAEIAAEIG